MKPSGLILLPIVMGLFVSCQLPEYDIQIFWHNPNVTVHFIDPVTLPFDLSDLNNKYPTRGLEEDCKEICNFHNITYEDGVYGYSINGFDNVLTYMSMFNDGSYWTPGGYSKDRRPSIILQIMTADSDSVHTKSFREMEVTSDSLRNIRFREYSSFSLSIESFKSKKNKLRVKWDMPWSDLSTKYFTGVSGNVFSARWDPNAFTPIYKFDSGLATNSSGEVIQNTIAGMDEDGNYLDYDEGPGEDPEEEIVVTVDDEEDPYGIVDAGEEEAVAAEDDELLLEDYCEDENPLVSPTLLRPIYSGGRFQENLRWRIPTFYTRVN